jgi:hypothetical protein
MTETEHPREDADLPGEEPERDEVAGRRGGQPGYDLDESELYEERDEDAPDD